MNHRQHPITPTKKRKKIFRSNARNKKRPQINNNHANNEKEGNDHEQIFVLFRTEPGKKESLHHG